MTPDQIARERVEFEVAFTRIDTIGHDLDRSQLDPASYVDSDVQLGWECWLARASRIPEGYALVPVEPTEAMIEAWSKAYPDLAIDAHWGDAECARADWKAMITASQTTPADQGSEGEAS